MIRIMSNEVRAQDKTRANKIRRIKSQGMNISKGPRRFMKHSVRNSYFHLLIL